MAKRACPYCLALDMDAASCTSACGYADTLPSDAARDEYRRSGADAPCSCDIGWEEALARGKAKQGFAWSVVWIVFWLTVACVMFPPLGLVVLSVMAFCTSALVVLFLIEAL